MNEQTFPFWAVFQVLENRLVLARVLGFPEVGRLGRNLQRLRDKLQRDVRKLVEREPLARLYQRQLLGQPTVQRTTVELEPVGRSIAWREPLPLAFPTVC